MGRRPSLSEDDLLDRLTLSFRRTGYDGASLSSLATDAGLNKSALYHHFPAGKEGMARAVIDHVLGGFARAVDRAGPSAEARIDALLGAVSDYFGRTDLACLLGNIALSEPDAGLLAAVRHGFAAWLATLTELQMRLGRPRDEAVLRAEDAVVRLEGALILARALGDRTVIERQIAALGPLLLQGLPVR